MYKFSKEFSTLEEMKEFIDSLVDGQGEIEVSETADVSAPKAPAAKRSRAKAPAKETEVKTPTAAAPGPFTAPAPAPAAPAPVAYDVEGARKHAIDLVERLKATGVPNEQLMPIAHQIYQEAGIPMTSKISTMSAEELQKFVPAFELRVNQIATQKNQEVASSSFI